MLDFTSALYLGLRHPSWSLRPWAQLTMGVPAALASPPSAREIASAVAALQGCERGTFGTSTLHLFWDLFGMLTRQRVAIYVDAGAYPIARWGAERAAARNVPVRSFPHHDAEALCRQLKRDGGKGLRPFVVTDGFCPRFGKPAPLAAYLDCVRAFGGSLILDDTQALGIFGRSPGPDAPYGRGGGGMLAWNQLGGPDVLVVSSLAKAFGVPLAVLSGSNAAVEDFESKSETQMHCSPPSVASLRAAERALQINRWKGDLLRSKLAGLVMQFRRRLKTIGLVPEGKLFPVQTISTLMPEEALALHEQLLHSKIRTVLLRGRGDNDLRISFLINADHRPELVGYAADILSDKLRDARLRPRRRPGRLTPLVQAGLEAAWE